MSDHDDSITPPAQRRAGHLGAHSIDEFAITVPDLAEARGFYLAFGLDVRTKGDRLGLYTHGNPHRWGVVTHGGRKALASLSFGVFADEIESFDRHLAEIGAKRIAPPDGAPTNGIWMEGFDGLPIRIVASDKNSPSEKTRSSHVEAGPGVAGAVLTSQAPRIQPRRLAHFAIFVTDVDAAITFYEKTVGLRLSDRSGPFVAFLHGAHGSDHHMLALVASNARGMHHISWDVGSVNEVGLGAGQMHRAGYARGWGLGRHVLGANYFHYVRDPWGSYCEYSADIDFIPHDVDWASGDHAPEDSMFLWGPLPPDDFVTNFEADQPAQVADPENLA